MDKSTLRKAQLTQLEILKAFRRVCDNHGIKYILSSGTLLGAIRHNGFIPWDDDVDIDMTREHYNRFLQHAGELGDEFYVQTWENDKEYSLPFAKVRMKGTVYQEENSPNLKNNGIYIDIFPCDRFYKNKSNKLRFLLMNGIRWIVLKRSPVYIRSDAKKNKLRDLFILITRLIPRSLLIKIYDLLATQDRSASKDYMYFENGGASRIGSWVIDAECFENTALHKFEDDLFSVPQNYDMYLSMVYGDYMQLPPEDKRENRHGILKVIFKEK